MAFQTGLSGLNAASRSLDVIGNNISNANTTGMKSSRAEFADVVATSVGGGSGSTGLGVAVETVSQSFTQGNTNITGNDLDVAVIGNGMFQLKMPNGTTAYTRAGNFKLDNQGNIVTNSGAQVMGYPTTIAGVATNTTPSPLTIPTGAPVPAKATSAITAEFNLNAAAPIAATVVPPTPRTTYGTALTTYDSQGMALPVNLYFTKVAPTTVGTDQWAVYDSLAPAAVPVGNLVFNASGQLTSGSPMSLTLTPAAPSIVPPFVVSADMSKASQFATPFGVTNWTQNGYPPGSFVGLKIAQSGVITASYSNGQSQAAGMLALADFRNLQGLAPGGGNNWTETFASGQPLLGQPGQGKFGSTRSGALEDSNIDLTAELVNMMTAQRAYQANAQTIKTQDQVMQTLVNMR